MTTINVCQRRGATSVVSVSSVASTLGVATATKTSSVRDAELSYVLPIFTNMEKIGCIRHNGVYQNPRWVRVFKDTPRSRTFMSKLDLTVEECEEKIGHCWHWSGGWEWCKHCGLVIKVPRLDI